MTIARTPLVAGLPVDIAAALAHARLEAYDQALLSPYIEAAAAEVEAYCDLALLAQTIAYTTADWPGQIIDLGVGPVASGAVATVEVIEADGTATPVTSGFWLEAGRYPRLHWPDTTPAARLRISYLAGHGDTAAALPSDLAHAVQDQAAHLFDTAGGPLAGRNGLSLAASRIAARYRRVRA